MAANAEQLGGNTTAAITGNEGCKCTDQSVVLASLTERQCKLPGGGQGDNEEDGVLLTVEGPCVPHSYGSNICLAYDSINLPDCVGDDCSRPWCYVDAKSCMLSSTERLYRSVYFPYDSGVDLFYSFTTCDSSFDDFGSDMPKHVLGGVTILATSPTSYIPPYVYKRDPTTGEILSTAGDEYYNNSVPYEGFLVHYLDQLQDLADGDFKISYTYGSKASKLVHPTSSFTAAVQDIGDGLVDMAVSGFWVTGQRLQIASFAEPLYFGKVMLVIPNPSTKDSISEQTSKVLEPFAPMAWVLIMSIITAAALLSVIFAEQRVSRPNIGGGSMAKSIKPKRQKKSVYARLVIDSFLEKGMFFCSAGVEQKASASLPYKFGFGGFILIVVASYVANLAAFLTRSGNTGSIQTMEEVVEANKIVCASPTLETELKVAWPSAKFEFNRTDSSDYGLLAGYDSKLCDFLAVSRTDSLREFDLMDEFCVRNLVFTDSVIYENQVAFPIRAELAAGLSYWMYQGEKYHGITVEASRKVYESYYTKQPQCALTLRSAQTQENEDGDYARISPGNLFFPSIFFLACAIFASILHLYHKKIVADGNPRSLIGRTSTLVLPSSKSLKGCPSPKMDDESRHENIGRTLSASREWPDSEHQENERPDSPQQKTERSIRFLEGVAKVRSQLQIASEESIDKDFEAQDEFCENSRLHRNEKAGRFSNGKGSALSQVQSVARQSGNDCAESAGGEEEELLSCENDATNATSRLEKIVEGAFDDILTCLDEIKRQKKGL